jgi:hypothetical protein
MRRVLVLCLITLSVGAAAAVPAAAATRAQVKAAAVKAVGGGRAVDVEHRSRGRGWEVHVVRSGRTYEVKLTNRLRVTKVEREGADHDAGDDHGSGGHGSDD